ncbi:phosphate ABC transporter permease subunit PstC [Haloterrigena salifodinae]|uniref:Phosphate transport system permease protein n=1 Tax=Haloterrigena salifodinae TaxID=2675099 RepID=A0A8T8DVI7_9EURY|nr:phosphate ABC transporter permease subunit PstC [Haloterrigena salifodinae]QRV13519.1 phosphate ABC transporter permease subunit PstC [Haloterrigena salifodinae]
MSETSIEADLTQSANARNAKERLYHGLLFGCATLTVFVTISIIVTLAIDTIEFFRMIDPYSFFTGTRWVLRSEDPVLGVLPLVSATLTVTIVSALVAIPIGTAAAVYLSEYASDRMRSVLKPALEILAGIPTVVYGFFALVYLTPWLQQLGLEVSLFNLLSASIMVGIMIIPMVSSISEDAMSAVPDSLRQAGYGLGATKFEVTTKIVIPASISGIFSSYILALSRAIGETMIVVVAGGSMARMFDPSNPFANLFNSGQTMTAAMVQAVTTDLSGGTPGYYSMFAIGLTLFAITFTMNLLSNHIAARYREEYQ